MVSVQHIHLYVKLYAYLHTYVKLASYTYIFVAVATYVIALCLTFVMFVVMSFHRQLITLKQAKEWKYTDLLQLN